MDLKMEYEELKNIPEFPYRLLSQVLQIGPLQILAALKNNLLIDGWYVENGHYPIPIEIKHPPYPEQYYWTDKYADQVTNIINKERVEGEELIRKDFVIGKLYKGTFLQWCGLKEWPQHELINIQLPII